MFVWLAEVLQTKAPIGSQFDLGDVVSHSNFLASRGGCLVDRLPLRSRGFERPENRHSVAKFRKRFLAPKWPLIRIPVRPEVGNQSKILDTRHPDEPIDGPWLNYGPAIQGWGRFDPANL